MTTDHPQDRMSSLVKDYEADHLERLARYWERIASE